jgi:ParB family chromosome partitioning protein
VTNTLRLLQLPSGVQQLLAEGQISAGHARALLGTPDRGFQEALAKSIVADGLTVRAVEEAVRARTQPDEPDPVPDLALVEEDKPVREAPNPVDDAPVAPAGPRRLPPPGLLELEELLSSHLNTRVKVDMSTKRGKVVVDFATLEDLERIYKLMVGELASTTE